MSLLIFLDSKEIKKIIVCDNSGFDYSKIFKVKERIARSNKKFEFLKFNGSLSQIQEFGKGYGEGEIMTYVFKNSDLIKEDELSFIKITGRLKVINIDLILNTTKPLHSYFQSVNLNPFVKFSKVDTRFYMCTKQLFKDVLQDSFHNVNDKEGYFLEHAYYHALTENKTKYNSFLFLPNFLGISGSTGQVFKMSTSILIFRQTIHLLFKNFRRK